LIFKWISSLKFKIAFIFSVGLAVAFSINWYVAIQTIHTEKEQDVENVLHHLLVESRDEYLHDSLSPASDLSFLYSIPHIEMILNDSEVSRLQFKVSKKPFLATSGRIVSNVRLSNGNYFNAFSSHDKIDQSVMKYGQKLLFRYLVSLVLILIVVIFVLNFYMKPLGLLAQKTREWKKEDQFDLLQEDAGLEIKEVAHAFSALVKRLESYRLKENELFKEAAHELKTPLALMRSRLDVYEQSDDYEKSKFIQELARDLERLTAELKNVLFLESADFEEATVIDVHTMLTQLKEKMDILIRRKNLQIDISEATFHVKAAEKLIYKVCGALIENATTYATYNSTIQIDINPNGRIIQIRNNIGNDKYLFSSRIGNKILNRLSKEIGYEYSVNEANGVYSIQIQFDDN